MIKVDRYHYLFPLPMPEMSQQPAETFPSSVHSPSTPARGAPSLVHAVIDPPTDAMAPDSSLKPHEQQWKRHFVPRSPILLAYLALLFVTTFLFVAAVSNSGDHYAADQLPPNKNGVGSLAWQVRAIRLNQISQVAILGDASQFDELDTQGQLSVTWLVVGCGEYGPQAAGETSGNGYAPVDRAVDVYLDEWVKFACFATWGLLSDEILVHQNRPSRMIRPSSRWPGLAENSGRIFKYSDSGGTSLTNLSFC